MSQRLQQRNHLPIAVSALALAVAGLSPYAARADHNLAEVTVYGHAGEDAPATAYPATTESVTAKQAETSINVMNTEDTVKYLPSILVRKRFIGDTDAPLATRTTGINASARSLVYADGVLLSALINNNNGNGSPRWSMVAPAEIARVDVYYGPFSARYPGNSYGAVVDMTTRMPDHLEGSVQTTQSVQTYKQYGSSGSYGAQQYAATVGNRVGPWSFWLSANHLDSNSQPVSYGTLARSSTAASAADPVVSGASPDRNRTGSNIVVLGPGNLTHTVQDSGKLKLALDFSPTLQAGYTYGVWQANTDLRAQTLLRDASGNPYFGGNAGTVTLNGQQYKASDIRNQFLAGSRDIEHQMNSFTLKNRLTPLLDWDMVYSRYDYSHHQERTSTGTLYTSAVNGGPGRILDMTGTGWENLSAKANWRPSKDSDHLISAGVYADRYTLQSPTFNTSNWSSGGAGSLYQDARGKTATRALWAQDAWRLAPKWLATVGGRLEQWQAYDGSNAVTSSAGALTRIGQPGREAVDFSPKATLAWSVSQDVLVTASIGRAVRYPTVGELFQTIQVGPIFQTANPNLAPEKVLTQELAVERFLAKGKVRLAVFQEQVNNSIISQTALYPGIAAPTSYLQNIAKTRQIGAEAAFQREDFLINGFDLNGSATYVHGRIVSDPAYVAVPGAAAGLSAEGQRTPYIPTLRATLVGSYHQNARLTHTVAARYSGRVYATVDNTDLNTHTYQGFDGFVVVDARSRYAFDKHWSTAVGIDNLNNQDYYLFHPFPQRTYFAELKYEL